MANILICDDEKDIVNALKIYLNDPDYVLFEAHNGKEAVETVRENEIHLVLLDIMMPLMNGIEAMSQIRGFSNVPIILLTAKSEDADKVLGLNVGADDYITKPFSPLEVCARVKSQLRRYLSLGAGATKASVVLTIGGLELDYDARTVLYPTTEVATDSFVELDSAMPSMAAVRAGGHVSDTMYVSFTDGSYRSWHDDTLMGDVDWEYSNEWYDTKLHVQYRSKSVTDGDSVVMTCEFSK